MSVFFHRSVHNKREWLYQNIRPCRPFNNKFSRQGVSLFQNNEDSPASTWSSGKRPMGHDNSDEEMANGGQEPGPSKRRKSNDVGLNESAEVIEINDEDSNDVSVTSSNGVGHVKMIEWKQLAVSFLRFVLFFFFGLKIKKIYIQKIRKVGLLRKHLKKYTKLLGFLSLIVNV